MSMRSAPKARTAPAIVDGEGPDAEFTKKSLSFDVKVVAVREVTPAVHRALRLALLQSIALRDELRDLVARMDLAYDDRLAQRFAFIAVSNFFKLEPRPGSGP